MKSPMWVASLDNGTLACILVDMDGYGDAYMDRRPRISQWVFESNNLLSSSTLSLFTMASVVIALALCAGVAFAAAPACPKEHATVISTDTRSAATTVSDYKTVTEDPETWTRTLSSYNATITASAAGDSPSTSVVWVTDATVTSTVTTRDLYTYTCSETITK